MQVIHTSSNGHSGYCTSDEPLNTKSARVSGSFFRRSPTSPSRRKRIKVTDVPPPQTQAFIKQFRSLLNLDADHADYDNQVQACYNSLQTFINDDKLEKLNLCPLLEELGNIDTNLSKCINTINALDNFSYQSSYLVDAKHDERMSVKRLFNHTKIHILESFISKLSETGKVKAAKTIALVYRNMDRLLPGQQSRRAIAFICNFRKDYEQHAETYMTLTRFIKEIYWDYEGKRKPVVELYENLPEDIARNPKYSREIQDVLAHFSAPFIIDLEEKRLDIFLPDVPSNELEEIKKGLIYQAIRSIDSAISVYIEIWNASSVEAYYRKESCEPTYLEAWRDGPDAAFNKDYWPVHESKNNPKSIGLELNIHPPEK